MKNSAKMPNTDAKAFVFGILRL